MVTKRPVLLKGKQASLKASMHTDRNVHEFCLAVLMRTSCAEAKHQAYRHCIFHAQFWVRKIFKKSMIHNALFVERVLTVAGPSWRVPFRFLVVYLPWKPTARRFWKVTVETRVTKAILYMHNSCTYVRSVSVKVDTCTQRICRDVVNTQYHWHWVRIFS